MSFGGLAQLARASALHAEGPVSYTHLLPLKSSTKIELSFTTVSVSDDATMPTRVITVSYTHLDVYKRQVYHFLEAFHVPDNGVLCAMFLRL